MKSFELMSYCSIFWQNCTGGLLNHEDFFDTIAENVTFYTGKVTSLENHRVLLNTGDEVPSDALLCGTGWVASHLFFSENQCRELGLPHQAVQESLEEKKHWSELEAKADTKVLNTFPQLADPPSHYEKIPSKTAYRLYRNIVPLCESTSAEGDRSIVFIGHVGVGNYFRAVECQSMWATAYLDGKLELPSIEEQEKEIALFTAWNRRRYLSKGQRGNTMIFELIGYTDTLLRDMGLNSHLKGWFKDIFATCWARDLKNLKSEFIDKLGYNGVVSSK
jgi:dimethylaniline monooxygenase (N-oxide forming)